MQNSDFLLSLRDFKIDAIIGVLPKEKVESQTILLNLEIVYSGSLIDYAIIREDILEIFKNNNFAYLENALKALQDSILSKFSNIKALSLEIKKLKIFMDCTPSVAIKWERE